MGKKVITMMGVLLCTLLNSCAFLHPVCGDLTLPGITVSPSHYPYPEYRYWQAAAERVYNATGVYQDVEYRECFGSSNWCAIKQSDLGIGETDLPRLGITRCDTNVIVIQQNVSQLSEIILHEYIHSLGVLGHVPTRSIMNPIVSNGADCITQSEIDQICTLQACQWEIPEVCPEDEWL